MDYFWEGGAGAGNNMDFRRTGGGSVVATEYKGGNTEN